jgi:putative effector of murein hydrolase
MMNDIVLDSGALLIISIATALTLISFAISRWLAARAGHHPLVNPILLAAVLVIGGLFLIQMNYPTYREGAEPLRWFMGPAIVALALPIWRERERLRTRPMAIALGIIFGATVGAALGIAAGTLFGLPIKIVLALAPKTTTSPFAIKIMEQLGGSSTLAAIFVILSGAVCAMLLPSLLTLVGVRDPAARGLALGSAGHIVGTQRATTESPISGSLAALAMALTGIATAVIVPILWYFVSR